MSPARFSVRQHILVNLLFFLALLAGLVMLARVPVDFYPDVSFASADINTVWSGASAQEVERLVTTKIEDEIANVAGIKTIRSFSGPGLSEIDVEWDETLSDTDYQRHLAELRAALERVEDLPEDAEEPVLRELSVAEVYASVIVAVVDDGGVGELAIREVARDLGDRVDDLPGVRRATLRAVRDRELRVLVDRPALERADLTLAEVAETVRRNNQNVPAGSFTNGSGETTVRATGDFTTPAAAAATVVKQDPGGAHVRLGDIADVQLGFERRRLIGRYNGRPAAIVEVAKERHADLVDVVTRLRRFLDERRETLPEGIRLAIAFDQSAYVMKRLDALGRNLLCGAVVVLVVLWLTLGFRNALLAISALPFCYLVALFLFPVFGLSINALSIVGMILVSGMLVDDAIIVLENVYRHVEAGATPVEAIITGADEVKWPVIASVATTIAAFAPLLLVQGVSGEFMAILPKTVIICLVASLIECLFALPAHYLHWGSRHTAGAVPRATTSLTRWSYRLRAEVDGTMGRLRDGYVRLLGAVLANRTAFAAALVGLGVFTVGVAARLPVDLFASEYNQVFVSLYGPSWFGLEDTDAVMQDLEAVLQEFDAETEVRDFSTYVGMTMNPDAIPVRGPHLGVAYVTFADTVENREHPDRMLAKLRARLEAFRKANPHRLENLLALPPRDGPPVGKPVAVQIRVDDYGVAKDIARQMKGFLLTMPGVYNVEDNLLSGPREVRLVMDEARAGVHGLTFADLATALRAANDGLVVSTYKPPDVDEDIDLRVLFAAPYRRDEHALMQAEVRTAGGYRVKLQDVARLEVGRGWLSLTHHDTRRSVVVYADVVEGEATSESVNTVLQARFADLEARYPGVEIVYGGEFQESARAFANTLRILPLAILLIYVILAAQFRSYVQPLVVMGAVPFGIIGVLLGLWLFGYPLSNGAMYVIIGLAGVVVNDSLVLVDFINRSREAGTPLREAVLVAGRTRFRAVLLTTLTTVGALLPTALGLFGRSVSFGPFAASFATGLALATVFTLFVVPVGYDAVARLGGRRTVSAEEIAMVPSPS